MHCIEERRTLGIDQRSGDHRFCREHTRRRVSVSAELLLLSLPTLPTAATCRESNSSTCLPLHASAYPSTHKEGKAGNEDLEYILSFVREQQRLDVVKEFCGKRG